MKSRWWWCTMWLLACSANAQTLQPEDFAFGLALQFDGNDALVETNLPPSVYQAVTRRDLGDLRVFNGANAVVAHVLRLPPAAQAERVVHTPPMFPIHAGADQALDAVVMNVQRDAHGRIERIETAARRSEHAVDNRRVVAYIVDTSAIVAPLMAIEFDWHSTAMDILGTFSMQASDDLTHWSSVLADVGIASLEFGGERLERRRVEFAPRRAKYFRVSWPAGKPLPALPTLRFEEVAHIAAAQRQWAKVALRAGAATGEYTFALPGHPPVDRARVTLLPQANRVLHMTVQARADSQSAWAARAAGPVYRLKLGAVTLDSPPLALTSGSAREWMLKLAPSEGLENVEAALELGWVPHQLVFVASGAGPFRLAYGASGVAPLGGALGGVLAEVEKSPSRATVITATSGAPYELGGPDRLSRSPLANWRIWALWAALLAAVALLGWMAWSLARRMAREEIQSGKSEL